MSDTKRDIVVRINEEMDEYDEQYGDGMTHEDGFDFAKRLHSSLHEASIEIVRLRAERDATLADRDRLITALEFYASPDAWTQNALEGNYGDYGDKAREALAAVPPRDVKGDRDDD